MTDPRNATDQFKYLMSGPGQKIKDAPETVQVNGVWYDRRDTVDALTVLLAEARTKIAAYKEVIREYRKKELAANPTPPIQSTNG